MNGCSKNSAPCPQFKLILLGDAGVGKTSIFMRVKDNVFLEQPPPTIPVDNCRQKLMVGDTLVHLCLWDTAGVERFRTITRNFYRNADAVLMVFSLDEMSTLFSLNSWEQDVKAYAPTALRFLLGNKTDLGRAVSQDVVASFATNHNCESAFMASAKTGEGISNAFQVIAHKLFSLHKTRSEEQQNSWLSTSVHVNQGKPNIKSGCC
ncbi:ras-related protein Rab-43-like [Physella acuta]|uniref:ras-related protein Rab-43-like n=1 Tax=Physella acuta TaxID=109671 RepID=UPI0027DD07CE|nr:ras-related protein Rab-43-like [Physella acuta]